MSTTITRRISLVAAGTLLTGTAAAATFGLLGASAAGAATAPKPASASVAHMRSVDHYGKGAADRIRFDASSGGSRDKYGSRDHSREHSRDHSRDHRRDHSRDHRREHSRDHRDLHSGGSRR